MSKSSDERLPDSRPVHPDVRPPLEGTWPADDLRCAFVMGAKWWEYYKTGFTMWQSDRNLAEEEAERRYPNGKAA